MSSERPYHSSLREAQTSLTRERIFTAAKEYLEENDVESLTLRRVADLSGVSPPTVYAYFPTMDTLVAAFFQWLKPRIGLDRPLPPLAELPMVPFTLFPLYDSYGALLRSLMNRPSWDRARHADRGRRHGGWIREMEAHLPGLSPEQLRRATLIIASFWGPTHWRWLMDTCAFPPDEAQRVASWSIRAMIAGLKIDPYGLDETPAAPPACSAATPSHSTAHPPSDEDTP